MLRGLAHVRPNPIELFAPAEADEPKPKRSRKSKRNDKTAITADTSTDSDTPGAGTQAAESGVEVAAIDAENPEVDQAPPATGPQPTSLKEVLADPPIIGDVGMPEPPDAVEAFFDSNEELADVDPKKSKRKLFRKSSK